MRFTATQCILLLSLWRTVTVDAALVWYYGPTNQVDCHTVCASVPTSTGCDASAFTNTLYSGLSGIQSEIEPNAYGTTCPATLISPATVCGGNYFSFYANGEANAPYRAALCANIVFLYSLAGVPVPGTCAGAPNTLQPPSTMRRFCPCTVPTSAVAVCTSGGTTTTTAVNGGLAMGIACIGLGTVAALALLFSYA